MRRTTKATTRNWQPLLFTFCLMFSVMQAAAQQRCDSIRLLFPDSATAIVPGFSATQSVLDSIAASLKLPPNIGRKITLSDASQPMTKTDARQDSVRRLRLESVALFLSGCSVPDSLIIFQSDTCGVFVASDSLKTATPTDTIPYIYNDSVAASLQPDTVHTVWLHIDGGQWLGTGNYDVYQQYAADMSASDSLSVDTVAVVSRSKTIPPTGVPVTVKKKKQSPARAVTFRKQSPAPASTSPKQSPTSASTSPKQSPTQPAVPKTSSTDMEQIENLKSLVSRQHDTISQLRQQLAEAIERGNQALQQTTAGVPMFWLWVLLLLAALLLAAFLFKRRQYAKAARRLNDQELRMNNLSMELNRQREELEKIKAATAVPDGSDADASATQTGGDTFPVSAPASPVAPVSPAPQKSGSAQSQSDTFENMWRGKALYASLVNGSVERIDHWGREEITGLVEYYRLLKRSFVESMENDYNSLSRNHKLFLILEDLGKTDAEIQKLLNITQTTIRSLRFRIRAKRKNGNNDSSDDSGQLRLFF